MAHMLLKTLTSSKRSLKISALLLGFLCWSKLTKLRDPNGIVRNATHLFLPEPNTVLHCTPSPVCVHTHEKSDECKEFYEQPQSNS